MGLEDALAHRATWITAAMTAVAPLACLRSLDALRHTSVIALLAAVRTPAQPLLSTILRQLPPPALQAPPCFPLPGELRPVPLSVRRQACAAHDLILCSRLRCKMSSGGKITTLF